MYIYLYICVYTLWLFNIAMENHHFLVAKPSISMGHGLHGYASLNQRVYTIYLDTHDITRTQ